MNRKFDGGKTLKVCVITRFFKEFSEKKISFLQFLSLNLW
jgi:hypothetical protein